MKRTVIKMMDEAASIWGNAPYALKKGTSGWISVSFSEARDRSREFAAWLVSEGFKKGDRLAILAEGSPEWIIAESGMLCAACILRALIYKVALGRNTFPPGTLRGQGHRHFEESDREGTRFLRGA